MKNKEKNRSAAFGALAAALYVVLTYLSSLLGIASGPVQLRLSEALCVLPVFNVYAVPGLAAGCLIANLLTGCALWDIIFGTAATLAGAAGTYLLRRHPVAATLPPVIANCAVVPLLLVKVYSLEGAYSYFLLTCFIGEFISCCILGTVLRKLAEKSAFIKR